jgi:hypothetical protein
MYTVYIVNNFNNYNYKYDDLHSNDWGWYIDTEIMEENVTTNLENNFNYTKKTNKTKKLNNKINELYTIIEEDYEYYMYDDNEIKNNTYTDIVNNTNMDIVDNEYFRYSISQKNRYELYNKILNVCCIVMLYSLITYYIWCII